MRTRLVALRVVPAFLLAAIALAGCRREPTAVATVNGRPVLVGRLIAALPWLGDTMLDADSIRRSRLDAIVEQELFVQEAERRGYDSLIRYRYELEERGVLIQELYKAVVAEVPEVTELELEQAHALLEDEIHLKVIEVEDDKTIETVSSELDRGVPFETLAARYSISREARQDGDLGFMPELSIVEPMRSLVQALNPGEVTRPASVGGRWRIVKLVERRPADPPPPPLGEMRQQLEHQLSRQRRREAADRYLAELRGRLEYVDSGLDILCKPPDQISPAEHEAPVAIRDGRQYVKVGRLLQVARRFTPALDTGMRKYAIRREIEEDLMYEDALDRGLGEAAGTGDYLAEKRRQLLYEKLYEVEVTEKSAVADNEVRDYFNKRRANYPDGDTARAYGLIRERLAAERRAARMTALTEELRSRADIRINEKVLASAQREPTENQQ